MSLPTAEELTKGLTSVLGAKGLGPVVALERKGNPYASSSRSEIVTCELADGRELRLLCKYEARDSQVWSNVAYEAEVYRQLLEPAGICVPGFYGEYEEPTSGKSWLILEFLRDSTPLNLMPSSSTILMAAEWLGRFHAEYAARIRNGSTSFLAKCGAEYYRECARRTLSFAAPLQKAYAWLPVLCERFDELAETVESQLTFTHGDYSLHNLLLRDGVIYLVDWELAGIDLGHVELVYLSDGWSADVKRQSEKVYQQARWPNGAPVDFKQAMDTARLCFSFYKLNSRPNWSTDTESHRYASQLRVAGEQLGLL